MWPEISKYCSHEYQKSQKVSFVDVRRVATCGRAPACLHRTHSTSGGICDRGWCHIICLWTKKNLNSTLGIDSHFQTFTVGLHVEFLD